MSIIKPALFLSATDMKVLKDISVPTKFNFSGYYLSYPYPVEYVEIKYTGGHTESATITLVVKYFNINDIKEIKLEGISVNEFEEVCEKLRKYLQFKNRKDEIEIRNVKISSNQEKLMIECEDINGSERTSETMIYTKVMTEEFKATLVQRRPIGEENNGEDKK